MADIKFDITIDARMINHSGIGTYLKNMIPNLIGNYSLALLGNTKILQSFEWSDKTSIFSADYPIYSISEQINLPRCIPKSKIFLSPHYNIPLRKILAERRVVIIHDVNHLTKLNEISIVKKMYARYMLSAALKKSDKVITDSNFSKSEIKKYLSAKEEDIKVVYCSIDGDSIKKISDKIDINVFRKKYKLPKDYFLYVGSIKPHKNLILSLKAFKILREEYSKYKLVLIGVKPDEFYKNEELIGLRDNVIVPGYIPDNEMPAVYKDAFCLVFPSMYEGFGLPPLEAMSCECPVITSNAASLPEVCGDAAIYFNPFNVDEFVGAMKQIIEDENLAVSLKKKGLENIKRFSWNNFSSNLKKEFDELL